MRPMAFSNRSFAQVLPQRMLSQQTAVQLSGLRSAVFMLSTCWLVGFSSSVMAIVPTAAAATPEPVRSLGMGGLLQAGLGLMVVVALIFLCGWVARRFGLQQTGGNRMLKVISSVMVGTRERVVVVEIAGQWLVLGVAAGQVRALHNMPATSPTESTATPPPVSALARLQGSGSFSQKFIESLNRVKNQSAWR